MKTINLKVEDDVLTITSIVDSVEDSVGYIQCEFTFNSAWASLTAYAEFKHKGSTASYQASITGGSCIVPYEALTERGTVECSVLGQTVEDDEILFQLTTNAVKILDLVRTIPAGENGTPLTASQYEQLNASKVDKAQGAAQAGKYLAVGSDGNVTLVTGGGGGGTTDFEQLSNRPSYNGTTMTHSTNIPEVKTSEWDAKADASDIPTKTSDLTNDSGFLTEHQSLAGYATESWVEGKGYLTSHQDISGKENTSNKVTSVSSASTDAQFPSAKCVYDLVGNIEAALEALL